VRIRVKEEARSSLNNERREERRERKENDKGRREGEERMGMNEEEREEKGMGMVMVFFFLVPTAGTRSPAVCTQASKQTNQAVAGGCSLESRMGDWDTKLWLTCMPCHAWAMCCVCVRNK